jgi:hypothetical protein
MHFTICIYHRSEACGGERRGGDHRVEPRRAAAGLRAGDHQRAGGGREGRPGPAPRVRRRRRPPRHRRLQGARAGRRRRFRKLPTYLPSAEYPTTAQTSNNVFIIRLPGLPSSDWLTYVRTGGWTTVVAGREAGSVLPGGGGRGRRVQRPAHAAGRVRAHHGAQRLHLPRRNHPQAHHHRVRQAQRHPVALVDEAKSIACYAYAYATPPVDRGYSARAWMHACVLDDDHDTIYNLGLRIYIYFVPEMIDHVLYCKIL